MRKNTKRTLWIISMLCSLIMFLGGSFAMFNSALSVSNVGSQKVYTPNWVTLECVKVAEDVLETTASFEYEKDKFTKIDCNEFTKQCDLSYLISEIEHSPSGLCGMYVTVIKCSKGDVCTEILKDTKMEVGGEQPITTLNPGEYLKITAYYNSGFLCNTRNPITKLSVMKRFDNWGLKIAGNTKLFKHEGDCNIVNKESTKDGALILGNKLVFDGGEGLSYVSYINDWLEAYSGNIYDYKNYGKVYCTGLNTLFKVEEVTMEGGEKVLFKAGTPIYDSDVECCNEMPGCKDFKWTNTPGDCPLGLDSECPNQGFWDCAGNNNARQFKCVNKNCVIQPTKEVKCCAPADCNAGYCDKSSTNPDDWKCKSGTPPSSVCGDNLCDSLMETLSSCPQDCKGGNKEEKSFLIPAIIIGAALVLAAIMLANKKKMAADSLF